MPEQVQKTRTAQVPAEEVEATPIPSKNVDGEAIKSEIDDLLDEIDAVLEDEEFAINFKQAGGQ